MKVAMRVILTAFTFIPTYFFVFWLPLSLIPRVHEIILLLIAAALSVLVWKKTANTSDSFASNILMGGLIVGGIGFVLGFFAPLIYIRLKPWSIAANFNYRTWRFCPWFNRGSYTFENKKQQNIVVSI